MFITLKMTSTKKIIEKSLNDRREFRSSYISGKLKAERAVKAKLRGQPIDVDHIYSPFSFEEKQGSLSQRTNGSYRGALLAYGERKIDIDSVNAAYLGNALGFAYGVMNFAVESGDVRAALQAARLYEKLGLGNKAFVHSKLEKAVELAKTNGWFRTLGQCCEDLYMEDVKLFKKRNPKKNL